MLVSEPKAEITRMLAKGTKECSFTVKRYRDGVPTKKRVRVPRGEDLRGREHRKGDHLPSNTGAQLLPAQQPGGIPQTDGPPKIALSGEFVGVARYSGEQDFDLGEATAGRPRNVWHRHRNEGVRSESQESGRLVRPDRSGAKWFTRHLEKRRLNREQSRGRPRLRAGERMVKITEKGAKTGGMGVGGMPSDAGGGG